MTEQQIDPHKTRFTAPLVVMSGMLVGACVVGWEARGKLAAIEITQQATNDRLTKIEKALDELGPQSEIVRMVADKFRKAEAKCPRFVLRGENFGICDMVPGSIAR